MTTISIEENLSLSQTRFKTLEDFERFVVELRQNEDLSPAHKKILDERLAERKSNPDNYLDIEKLKVSIVRRRK